jgi:hypothetical protein
MKKTNCILFVLGLLSVMTFSSCSESPAAKAADDINDLTEMINEEADKVSSKSEYKAFVEEGEKKINDITTNYGDFIQKGFFTGLPELDQKGEFGNSSKEDIKNLKSAMNNLERASSQAGVKLLKYCDTSDQ